MYCIVMLGSYNSSIFSNIWEIGKFVMTRLSLWCFELVGSYYNMNNCMNNAFRVTVLLNYMHLGLVSSFLGHADI